MKAKGLQVLLHSQFEEHTGEAETKTQVDTIDPTGSPGECN